VPDVWGRVNPFAALVCYIGARLHDCFLASGSLAIVPRQRSGLLGVVAGYVALNVAILAMNVVGTSPFSYIWVPFGFAAWWLAVRRDPEPLPARGQDRL